MTKVKHLVSQDFAGFDESGRIDKELHCSAHVDLLPILRRLSTSCNFGYALEDMLQDRLVCGLQDVALQRRVLLEKDLTFQCAFYIWQAHEVAARDTLNLQQTCREDTWQRFVGVS